MLAEQLQRRIADFKAKRWIDSSKEQEFLQLLSNHSRSNDGNQRLEKAVVEVQKTLDCIESRHFNNLKAPTIPPHPKIRNVNIPIKLFNVLTPAQIENVFVDMCFFARLGFLQPPCCLQCAYNGAAGTEPSTIKAPIPESAAPCNNLVVWRVNSAILLHPNKLDGNTLLVTCQTARAWLQGEVVQLMKWDSKAKKLVSASS